jgi:uncharacterized protein (UPF0335 family)
LTESGGLNPISDLSIWEHIEAVRAQVDRLENEINTMAEKIRDLTIEQLT